MNVLDVLGLSASSLSEIHTRRLQLAAMGVHPSTTDKSVYYAGCGDGTCAQSCSGGCGRDCSAFFGECLVKI